MELIIIGVLLGLFWPLFTLGLAAHAGFAAGLWLYGPYYYDRSERDGSRNWPEFRRRWGRPLWAGLQRLYRFRLAQPLPEPGPDAPVLLYACHPHGLFALFVGLTFLPGRTGRPGVRVAVHHNLMCVPVVRELLLWFGCIDASRDVVRAALQRGESVAVVPGGVYEMGAPVLPRSARPAGFLRLAAELGVPVVPVVCPAEETVVWTWRGEWAAVTRLRRAMLRVLRYPFPTFFWLRVAPPPLVVHAAQRALRPQDYPTFEAFAEAYWHTLDRLLAQAGQ